MHSLIEIHPLNTETGNREVVRISSVQDARINSLGGYKWRPCIIEQPSMNINLFDGDFNTAIQTGGGRFSFNIISILRDYPDFAAYALQGCRISIYVGEDNDTWPWVKLFEGNINRFEQSENKFSCSFRVDADKFAIDILSDTYAGTGGADGGSDLENRPKPWIFGFARNVEPLLINVVDNIYQFSSYGPIKEVLSLYERGSDFGSKIDDFADYDALLNADVPPGSWATCNEEGLFRLGAPAAGVITGDVEGDYHDGIFRRSPGEIVKRMAQHLGLNLTDLNIPSLDFVDAELSTWPQNGYVNLVIQNQISLIDLVQALARGCNYQSGVDWLGRLFWVKPQVSLSHSLSLHAQGLRLPKVTNSSQVDVSPPYSTIEMGGVRSHRVHNISEIATDLRLLGGYSATRVYVLDDVVSLPDNSTWRWQNTENGNSFPSQSSSDWELLTDAAKIDLDSDNVVGTLPIGKAVPELVNKNLLPTIELSSPVPVGITHGVTGNLKFLANQNSSTNSNNGEIFIEGGAVIVPNRGRVTIQDVEVPTPFEGVRTVQNKFYLVLSSTITSSRFNGIDRPGFIFVAVYDLAANQWTAVDNTNARFNFTPRADDCVIAVGEKFAGDRGISTLTPLVTYWPNLPDDGATFGATAAERALIDEANSKFPLPPAIAVGGLGNIELKKNFVTETTQNDGEIFIIGGRVITPNNGQIVIPSGLLITSWEGTSRVQDPFYVIWGIDTAQQRFPNFNGGGGNNIFTATYNFSTKQWRAVDNFGNAHLYEPLDTDLILATGQKFAGDSGISSLVSHVARWDGLPANNADVTADTGFVDNMNSSGRISDPSIFNTQTILGPKNVTNLDVSYEAGATNTVITFPAHHRIVAGVNGPKTISYGSASATWPNESTWFAYIDDPDLTGQSNPVVQLTGDSRQLFSLNRYNIGVGITPNSLGSGGSASTGGAFSSSSGSSGGVGGGNGGSTVFL